MRDYVEDYYRGSYGDTWSLDYGSFVNSGLRFRFPILGAPITRNYFWGSLTILGSLMSENPHRVADRHQGPPTIPPQSTKSHYLRPCA